MAKPKIGLSNTERALARRLTRYYEENLHLVKTMLKQLADAILESPSLMALTHSTKSRLKEPGHLQEKLLRKMRESKSKGKAFNVTESNLFSAITDLAGFRILHLHSSQIVDIDRELRRVFAEYRYRLFEKPRARTWDDEYREFFHGVGILTLSSPKMYTSVHYVVESFSETKCTCEIQVRTLAEELWGEVDHSMNYPQPSPVEACRDQIKVLARVTSSCSRLVDSIFRTSKAGGQ